MNIMTNVASGQYSSRSMLNDVRRLVEAGFAVHRLHPRSKAPIGNDWAAKPVLLFDKLSRAYRAGENVGARLGEYSKVGGGYLHVIDLDIRATARAAEARAKLTELFPEWETYPSVISGSGGSSRHLYLICDSPFPSKKLAHSAEKITGEDGKQHWAWEIELFGTGKQVVLPPSIHPDTGKAYRWERQIDFDNLELGVGPYVPSKRIEKLTGEQPAAEYDDERSAPLGLSEEEIRGILADIPAPTYCDDRDGWLNVGMALHHETNGSDAGFELWCEFSKRSEKFDARDQKRVWKSFRGKAKPLRMATLLVAAREARLEREFEDLGEYEDHGPEESSIDEPAVPEGTDESALIDRLFGDLLGDGKQAVASKRQQRLNRADVEKQLGHVPPRVRRLNERHAVAFISGRTVILSEDGKGGVAYGSVSDLHNFYENDRVATEKATEPVTKAWMRHRARRQYPNGVVFAPGQEIEGAYNHWHGFAVEPDSKGSCRQFLEHLRDVVCCGNEETYNYLIGWLAHMIQRPGEKPGVAVVLRGRKGAGKDMVGEYIGALFPNHHVKIASQEHLVGRFNQHQEKALLLHVEEGFWAGNKQAEGALKHLITSERVTIEPKGLNAFQVDSVLRVFISSNEDWVVPATGDERRFFVANVSDKKMQNTAYFDALIKERDNGGLGALLHHLSSLDLKGFDVRKPPATEGLLEQKIATLRNVSLWWYEILQSGDLDTLFDDDLDDGASCRWGQQPQRVSREALHDHYKRWMRDRRYDGEVLNRARFGVQIRTLCPSISDVHGRNGEGRAWLYVLPALPTCRSLMEGELGASVVWG